MYKKETNIEKIVRENTPDFVVGTSYLVEKYHSYKLWDCLVHFKKNIYVQKYTLNINKEIELKNYNVAMPDFVLNNKNQMDRLEKAIYNADNGLPYKNPFSRKEGWYIECFGDYWHSENFVGLSKDLHEKQVKEAYEKSGNHILILWECDILYHWDEYCLPKINEYLNEFKKENDINFQFTIKEMNPLSDLSLQCLNDTESYRILNIEDKNKVLDELVNKFSSLKPLYDEKNLLYDFDLFKKRCEEHKLKHLSLDGNVMINYFIRSRFDAKVKNNKTLNELWNDKVLMRKCIDWQFMHEDGIHHANRIFAAMTFSQGFRIISNLRYHYVYLRCKNYAKKGGIFFDPCAGWGGRMLGAYALGMKYIAIDANKKLVEELKELAKYINYDAEIYYGDSSDKEFVKRVLNGRKIDLSFTCPPYWKEEHYSDDEYQSDIMYLNKEEWYKNFLQNMIDGVRENMNDDGYFIISCDEKINWSYLKNFSVKLINCNGYNKKMEDLYFLIGNINEIENKDYVKCAICGFCMNHLSNHIQKIHNMSIEDYNKNYPDSLIGSEIFSEIKSNANQIKYINRGDNHHYNKRYVYLLPDGTYAPKSDQYKKAWGVDTIDGDHIIDASTVNYIPNYAKMELCQKEGDDYVVCKICGEKKGSLTQHIRRVHNMSKDEYIKIYNAPIYSNKNKEAFHNCALNKWKTQFDNGIYVKKEKKKKKEPILIEKEFIEQNFKEGYSVGEIANKASVSEFIIRKFIKLFNLKTPTVTMLHIRRAVRNGSKLNLELYGYDELQEMINKNGLQDTINLFGVKIDVFNTYLKEISKD